KKPSKNVGKEFRRFPVAGSLVQAQWLQGKAAFPWIALAMVGLTVVGAAQYLDRRSKIARLTGKV
ncbi:MAG: hypothetical protein AAB538_00955, partial [Patescibacteria group bacterium]